MRVKMSERKFRSLVAKGTETHAGYTFTLDCKKVELTVSFGNTSYIITPSTDIENLPRPVVKMVQYLDKYYTNNYIFRLTADGDGVYKSVTVRGHSTLVHPLITEDTKHFDKSLVCATPSVYTFNLWFKDNEDNFLSCPRELIVSIYRDIEVFTTRSGRQCMISKETVPFASIPYSTFSNRYGKY
jgi:hypothetical protein